MRRGSFEHHNAKEVSPFEAWRPQEGWFSGTLNGKTHPFYRGDKQAMSVPVRVHGLETLAPEACCHAHLARFLDSFWMLFFKHPCLVGMSQTDLTCKRANLLLVPSRNTKGKKVERQAGLATKVKQSSRANMNMLPALKNRSSAA